MMSNYSFLGSGSNSVNHVMVIKDEEGNTLEMTELEMQDLADSIYPIQSFDSLPTLEHLDPRYIN